MVGNYRKECAMLLLGTISLAAQGDASADTNSSQFGTPAALNPRVELESGLHTIFDGTGSNIVSAITICNEHPNNILPVFAYPRHNIPEYEKVRYRTQIKSESCATVAGRLVIAEHPRTNIGSISFNYAVVSAFPCGSCRDEETRTEPATD